MLTAFESYHLVGLGELHGNDDVHDFILTLVRDPRFAAKVRDIVVEFGNASYQSLVDDFAAGANVSIESLRLVWRNTVNPLTWDSPVYERFFKAVREMNATLSKERRLRIILGDVPVDWTKVQKMADLGVFASRDAHFAAVVEKEVLEKDRRSLLIAGQWHLYKRNPSVEDPSQTPGDNLNTAEILMRRHPGKLWIIQPADFGRGARDVEPRLVGWSKGSVARVRQTWLGAMSFGDVTPFPDKIRFDDGKEVEIATDAPFPWPTVEAVLDAYLWLGPKRELRWSKPVAPTYDDAAYLEELRRRARLMGYPPAHFKAMTGHVL